MADHDRKQERIIIGFDHKQLATLDELTTLILPGVEKAPRSVAIRLAIHEALERRKNSSKKSRKGA